MKHLLGNFLEIASLENVLPSRAYAIAPNKERLIKIDFKSGSISQCFMIFFFPGDFDLFPSERSHHNKTLYENVPGIASFQHVYALLQLNLTNPLHDMTQTFSQMW